MQDSWGYHLLLDCSKGNSETFTEENIRTFIKKLVKDIDMVAHGEPMIMKFALLSIDKAGHSFCQMIETSNITGHFVDSNGNFYIDVFSCKPFKQDVVLSLVSKYFEPVTILSRMVERNA